MRRMFKLAGIHFQTKMRRIGQTACRKYQRAYQSHAEPLSFNASPFGAVVPSFKSSNLLSPSYSSRSVSFDPFQHLSSITPLLSKSEFESFASPSSLFLLGGAALAFLYSYLNTPHNKVLAEEEELENVNPPGEIVDGLPDYSLAEISKHTGGTTAIWVRYKFGVYDITEFMKSHPGGDKILMAAGSTVEPFWQVYAVHNTPQVWKILETLRIGNVAAEDRQIIIDEEKKRIEEQGSLYSNEPQRSVLLLINSKSPFNAEPPLELVTDHYITPTPLFFIRNHLPVPIVDADTFVLNVQLEGQESVRYTLEDIKTKFPKVTVIATLQCAGNRRSEMNSVKEVKGLSWGGAAISNATWSGARLKDVLEAAGITEENCNKLGIQHIQFEGLDKSPDGSDSYGASIPLYKGIDFKEDVILAYEMNGESLPIDHGFPLRVIVPGTVGARNVKWVSKIVASKSESSSFWQRRDYKVFNPSTTYESADWDNTPAIQELPVQSAISIPSRRTVISKDATEFNIEGYAFSGGGKSIIRVDVSLDNGATWIKADLLEDGDTQQYNPNQKKWSWTLWKTTVPVTDQMRKQGEVSILCRATDSSHNSQPENINSCWNIRGLLCNAWHKITVKFD